MHFIRMTERRSRDDAWPIRRADGTKFNEPALPGYNPAIQPWRKPVAEAQTNG